jgi:DNA-binding NtrC family response regulator
MPGMDGIALLQELLAIQPGQCVVLMTAHGTIDSAVEAMRKGAFDY